MYPDINNLNSDIAYANGRSYMWDDYMSFIEPVASTTPYMVCPGNHEGKVF
jgi:hypothetical protein